MVLEKKNVINNCYWETLDVCQNIAKVLQAFCYVYITFFKAMGVSRNNVTHLPLSDTLMQYISRRRTFEVFFNLIPCRGSFLR